MYVFTTTLNICDSYSNRFLHHSLLSKNVFFAITVGDLELLQIATYIPAHLVEAQASKLCANRFGLACLLNLSKPVQNVVDEEES